LGTLFRFHTKRGLAADCDALCCAARDPARMAAVLQGQLYSTLLALPTVYAVLYKLHRDPVEEAAVAAKAAAARQHQHSSG
jgi:predicted solute-binding protein